MREKRPLEDCRLYTFLDTMYLGERSPLDLAASLCRGGSDIIQVRAKDWPIPRITTLAREIAPITEDAGVHLVINDRVPAADAIPSPFVHLGQEDNEHWGPRALRQVFDEKSGSMVGMSTHNETQCLRSVEAGADYVSIGPVFATPTKPGRPPVTTDLVRWAAANITIPWFAIGGINRNTIGEVLAAGARRICIVSAILDAEDPLAACRHFRSLLVD